MEGLARRNPATLVEILESAKSCRLITWKIRTICLFCDITTSYFLGSGFLFCLIQEEEEMTNKLETKNVGIETIAVHGSKGYDPLTGAISYPIYQSATFKHNGLNHTTGYDYARLQNPTREEVESTVAKLENGNYGIGFATGNAAVTAVLSLFKKGDHVLVSDDLYGGTYRLFEEIYSPYGIEHNFIDTTEIDTILSCLQPNTRGIFIETPSNPMMKITDLKRVVEIAKKRDILVIVDNTFLTPYFFQPLELGADLVVHSGTKYLGGHNDTLAGFVVTNSEFINERVRYYQKSTGASLAPFDSWLILRGIKTLHIRMEYSQKNAITIANFLKNHPNVTEVYYVGLPEHKGHEIIKEQAKGFGAMISFKVKNIDLVEKVLGSVNVITFAESLGGVESLITYPHTQTHSEMPEEFKKKIGLDDHTLRLSVGIEHVEDLIQDLENALG